MPEPTVSDRIRSLLSEYGRTYAQEANIRLTNTPAPLYQLLVLADLLSAPISAQIAEAAARELFAAGLRTPRAMLSATWQSRVDALGRGHYRRYDERTATMLGDGAELVLRRWRGDLRKLAAEAGPDPGRMAALLTEVPGIGPAGADIFLREVQLAWPAISPYLGPKAAAAARQLDLPDQGAELARYVSRQDMAALAAALIRAARVDRPSRAR